MQKKKLIESVIQTSIFFAELQNSSQNICHIEVWHIMTPTIKFKPWSHWISLRRYESAVYCRSQQLHNASQRSINESVTWWCMNNAPYEARLEFFRHGGVLSFVVLLGGSDNYFSLEMTENSNSFGSILFNRLRSQSDSANSSPSPDETANGDGKCCYSS